MAVKLPRETIIKKNKWLTVTSPLYKNCYDEWVRNERLLFGGTDVVNEDLILFDWEMEGGDRHAARRDTAVYVNYPERYCEVTIGHIFRQRPSPEDTLDFGGLGEVRRKRVRNRPTPAELIFYNTDGLGRDGSQWDPYWASVSKMATATGHRWVYVEGPPEAPTTRRQEINGGLRPYLTDFSPRAVLNHHYENGQLAFAVIQRAVRRPRIERGLFRGNEPEVEYLLLTREGFNAFGANYENGGWFTFDAEGNLTDSEEGWDATEGEIPLVPLYYERVRPQERMLRMSRSGIVEIGNGAVLHMNLTSAASYDLWDRAASAIALLGASRDGYNLFMEVVAGGSRFAPVPMNEDTKTVPVLQDMSMGATVGGAFNARIESLEALIAEIMLNEVKTAPDASGTAIRTSWTDARAPRLSNMASNIETAQNAVLPWLEGMWGERAPSASVAWKREFDLIDPQASGSLFFEMENTAGISSPTMRTKIMVQVAKAIGFLGDDEEEGTVKAEYAKSAKAAEQAKDALTAASSLIGSTNPGTARRGRVPSNDGRRNVNKPKRTPATNVTTN